jgi:arylsulfatase A
VIRLSMLASALLAAWIVAGAACGGDDASRSAPLRPNIVLIVADDLGREALGCYGGRSYDTPRLDRLSEQGVRFEHAFSTPLCTPSRVQLLTGRYPFRTGWRRNLSRHPSGEAANPSSNLSSEEITFARLLRDAGYATAIAGKWHVGYLDERPGHPGEMGFDRNLCWAGRSGGEAEPRYWSPLLLQDGSPVEGVEGRYGPDVVCEFLVDFITENRRGPFLVYYPMMLPHPPFHDPSGPADSPDATDQQRFAAMVGRLDRNVGRIVDSIEDLGIREQTLIVFTSDNGSPSEVTSLLGDVPVRGGKRHLTDAGTRVPLLASWPGTAPRGETVDDLVDLTDVFPTLLELAGVDPPEGLHIDGLSFAPRLEGRSGRSRPWVFAQRADRRCIRDERWKLHDDGRLYDLVNDPWEEHPIVPRGDDETSAAARARLGAILETLR